MVFFVFDDQDILQMVSRSWSEVRPALDRLLEACPGYTSCPRLEIYAESEFGVKKEP